MSYAAKQSYLTRKTLLKQPFKVEQNYTNLYL